MQRTARLNLSDLYAYVGEAIWNWSGFKEVNELSEQAAYSGYYKDSTSKPSRLFCGASNVYNDNMKGFYKGDETVTLVIPGLRDIYSSSKLPQEEQTMFIESMDKASPEFKDVSDYESIKVDELDIPLFQLIGDLTPYDVLHLSLADFISNIDKSKDQKFEFALAGIDYRLDIFYDNSDFYDPETDSILLK